MTTIKSSNKRTILAGVLVAFLLVGVVLLFESLVKPLTSLILFELLLVWILLSPMFALLLRLFCPVEIAWDDKGVSIRWSFWVNSYHPWGELEGISSFGKTYSMCSLIFNGRYSIKLPSGTIDLTIPREFNFGYGGVRTSPKYNKEYQFDETQATSRLNDPKSSGIKTLLIGILFINPARNFGKWDATVDLGVINYENSVFYNIENFNDLKSLFTEFASESYLLTNGEEVNDLGEITEKVLGENKTLILTRKDPFTVR